MSNGELTLEERKRRYIEAVAKENNSPERSWWQYPGPSYYSTDEYAFQFPEPVEAGDNAAFKKPKKNWVILIVMLLVAGLLIYIIGEQRFGFSQALFLALLLLVILPALLDNKPRIMISHVSLWLYKGDKNILWKDVVLTYIKQVPAEVIYYFLIVHYYDESTDDFNKIEIELDGLVSPGLLASTIHKFKPGPTA